MRCCRCWLKDRPTDRNANCCAIEEVRIYNGRSRLLYGDRAKTQSGSLGKEHNGALIAAAAAAAKNRQKTLNFPRKMSTRAAPRRSNYFCAIYSLHVMKIPPENEVVMPSRVGFIGLILSEKRRALIAGDKCSKSGLLQLLCNRWFSTCFAGSRLSGHIVFSKMPPLSSSLNSTNCIIPCVCALPSVTAAAELSLCSVGTFKTLTLIAAAAARRQFDRKIGGNATSRSRTTTSVNQQIQLGKKLCRRSDPAEEEEAAMAAALLPLPHPPPKPSKTTADKNVTGGISCKKVIQKLRGRDDKSAEWFEVLSAESSSHTDRTTVIPSWRNRAQSGGRASDLVNYPCHVLPEMKCLLCVSSSPS